MWKCTWSRLTMVPIFVLRSAKRLFFEIQVRGFCTCAAVLHVQAGTIDVCPCITREYSLSCMSAADLMPPAQRFPQRNHFKTAWLQFGPINGRHKLPTHLMGADQVNGEPRFEASVPFMVGSYGESWCLFARNWLGYSKWNFSGVEANYVFNHKRMSRALNVLPTLRTSARRYTVRTDSTYCVRLALPSCPQYVDHNI